MTEEELFFAWLDGELDAGEAAKVAARVAASPELAARAAEHRRLTASMKNAFAPVIEAEVPPPRFQSAEVIDFGAKAAGRPRFGVPQWAAMAATLMLGLLVGNLVGTGGEISPVTVKSGHLIASASLETALDHELASAPTGGEVRIGLTFRNARGDICRSFQDGPASGLACRDGDLWRMEGIFQGAESQSSDYRMAAGQDPRLAVLVAQAIAGEPFDAAQERAARDKGWR